MGGEEDGRRTVERSRRGPGYAYEDFVRPGKWGRNSDRLERTAEFGSDDSLMSRHGASDFKCCKKVGEKLTESRVVLPPSSSRSPYILTRNTKNANKICW